MTGRTAAYGRAAFAWAVKRGMVQSNPFAHLPVAKAIAKRERVLSDDEIGEVWRAVHRYGAAPQGAAPPVGGSHEHPTSTQRSVARLEIGQSARRRMSEPKFQVALNVTRRAAVRGRRHNFISPQTGMALLRLGT
jgi:hypothetical protein